jgi:hypothetical protein
MQAAAASDPALGTVAIHRHGRRQPLGLTIAWINRRGVDLHPSVPKPDFQLSDVASLMTVVDG